MTVQKSGYAIPVKAKITSVLEYKEYIYNTEKEIIDRSVYIVEAEILEVSTWRRKISIHKSVFRRCKLDTGSLIYVYKAGKGDYKFFYIPTCEHYKVPAPQNFKFACMKPYTQEESEQIKEDIRKKIDINNNTYQAKIIDIIEHRLHNNKSWKFTIEIQLLDLFVTKTIVTIGRELYYACKLDKNPIIKVYQRFSGEYRVDVKGTCELHNIKFKPLWSKL